MSVSCPNKQMHQYNSFSMIYLPWEDMVSGLVVFPGVMCACMYLLPISIPFIFLILVGAELSVIFE